MVHDDSATTRRKRYALQGMEIWKYNVADHGLDCVEGPGGEWPTSLTRSPSIPGWPR